MRFRYFIFLVLALPFNVMALDLNELYFSALQHDPELQVAVKQKEITEQNEAINRSYLLPNINYGYNRSYNQQDLTILRSGQSTKTPLDYTSTINQLSFNQTLFNLAQYYNYKKGVIQATLADATYKGKAIELVSRLTKSYFDVLYAMDQIYLLESQEKNLSEQVNLNQKLLELQQGTRTDLLETQAKLELIQVQLLQSNNTLSDYLRSLSSISGIDANQLIVLKNKANQDFSALKSLEYSYAQLENLAIENNADILIAKKNVEVAGEDIKIKEAGNYPTVTLQGAYGETVSQTVSQYNQKYEGGHIGAQLNIPIFAGGYNKATINQANATHEMTRADLNLKIEKLKIDLHKEYNLFNSLSRQISALTKARDSANLLIEANRKSIQAGTRINADLLNAEQQYFQVVKDLSKSKYDYSASYLRLKILAGVFSENDLVEASKNFISSAKKRE